MHDNDYDKSELLIFSLSAASILQSPKHMHYTHIVDHIYLICILKTSF